MMEIGCATFVMLDVSAVLALQSCEHNFKLEKMFKKLAANFTEVATSVK